MTSDQLVQTHHGTSLGQYEAYTLLDCETCGFIHVNPLPTCETLKAVYDEQFYADDKPDYLLKEEKEHPYWCSALYQPRYARFESLLSVSGSSEKVILDIGCSGGFFLRYGQEHGWRVLGVEPGRQAAAYAREVSRIDVIEGYFQDLPLEAHQNTYDVVHLRHVLEHLPNPQELCNLAYKVLKPGGLICIDVPNDFNPLQKLLQDELGYAPYWVAIPHHLNYFNRDSLTRLLHRYDFEVVSEEVSFPMEFFLLMGDNYVGNETLGQACHQKRMLFEQNLDMTPEGRQFRENLYAFLASQNVGRTITLYARKPLS